MRTAPTMKPLDAPPSSPEFIIKKPHDETRHRAKTWRSTEDATSAGMDTARGVRRVVRTYSKRQNTTNATTATTATSATNATNATNPSERPAKKRRTESGDTLPPLPPAASDSRAKKSTIEGYFSSASAPASARGPSSDAWSRDEGDGDVESPPSSPPARRWTSPRKLRLRPSLAPIAGGGQGAVGGKRKRDCGEGDGSDGTLKRVRSGELGGDESADEGRGEAGCAPDGACGVSGSVSKRPGSSARRGEADKESAPAPEPSSARPSLRPQSITPAVKRHPAPRDLPSNHDTNTTPPTTTVHDAGKDAVPNYTMPYKFYAANPAPHHPSPPPAAKTARRPARTVQTTLNLSTKQPFKECRLCDTVFNPLLAGDVRLHQVRHAKVLGGDGGKGRGRGRKA